MFRNLKIRTGMIIGYALVMLVSVLAILLGIFGLLSNTNEFIDYTDLSEEVTLAQDVSSRLAETRLAYKDYSATGDNGWINNFQLNYNHINMEMGAMHDIAERRSPLILEHLHEAEEYLIAYNSDFENLKYFSQNVTDAYDETMVNGEMMVELLTQVKSEAFNNGHGQMANYTSSAIQELLSARLYASKYFDFHDEEQFDRYRTHFNRFSAHVGRMIESVESSPYENDLLILSASSEMYRHGMDEAKTEVEDFEAAVARMDETGPMIDEKIDHVIEAVNHQLDLQRDSVIRGNYRWSLGMVIISSISIILLFVIGSALVRHVVGPIESMTIAFEDLSAGETDTTLRLPVAGNNEISDMSMEFNSFMEKLSDMVQDIEYKNFLKSGQGDLLNLSRDMEDLELLAKKVLQYVVLNNGALMGRMYVLDWQEGGYHLMANHGVTANEAMEVFDEGEGFLGRVANEAKVTFIDNVPETYMSLETSLGNSTPRHILLIPCVHDDRVNGIIELGHLKDINEQELEYAENLGEVIGNIIHSTRVRSEVHELLDKTIRQAEELQVQQEELLQSNRELEQQTQALKQSEQRLQHQQEELRVSNEELEEHSRQLEQQRQELDKKNQAIMASQDEIIEKAYALEEANRYKSEFLANMSHELRTPLNSILVLSQLIKNRTNTSPLSQKEMEFAQTIHSSGSDLLKMINGVLDLSKVEAGRLELISEEVSIEGIVRESEGMFKMVAAEKHIDFITQVSKGLPETIVTDRLRLTQVIKNLISNAIKFTHQGHVALNVRRLSDQECDYTGGDKEHFIAFEVRDTGIGIEQDKQDVIFEAFRQEDGTTSRNYGGTGLGLTISLEMARLLNGDIILESEVGVGSQFVMIVPMDTDHALENKETETALRHIEDTVDDEVLIEEEEVHQMTENETEGNSLLIIEDDPVFSDMLRSITSEQGYSTLVAHSGLEGIELAQSHRPKAIILDMGLPDMDGTEVAKVLAAKDATSAIPIHIISGREDLGQEGLPESIIGLLRKPVAITDIYRTLNKIESVGQKEHNHLLVVGHCGGESFSQFESLGQLEVTKVATGKEGLELLGSKPFGCIVLDTALEDMSGTSFVDKLKGTDSDLPVIIYTEEDIDLSSYEAMNATAEKVVIKGSKSKERLTDEISLFLHSMPQPPKDPADLRGQADGLAGKRVLLVDDDERNAFALCNSLEQYGMNVDVVYDGISGINLLKEHKFDMVVMDIMMPIMDGYDTMRRIRSSEGMNAEVPMIALTAKAAANDREQCIEAGANDYMTKPIEMEKMISLMKVWML